MAKVISSRSLRFYDESGLAHTVTPSDHPQELPDSCIATDHFEAAEHSGWVRLVKPAHVAGVAILASIAQMSDAEFSAELERRGIAPSPPDLEPVEVDLGSVSDEDLAAEFDKRMNFPNGYTLKAMHEDRAYRKISGIDGDAGDWTAAGQDATGFPVPKDSPADVTAPKAAEKTAGKTKAAK